MSTKTILVTGAASGIGRATARRFAAGGWSIAAFDLDATGLDELGTELGAERCWTRTLDVTDKVDFDQAVGELARRTDGHLDLLFNNAGIGAAGFFEDIPFEKTLDVVRVNLIGVLNGIHAALPLLKATPNSMCFSTASSAATFGAPGLAVYSATKFAVKGLTEALSVEFSRHGIRVADTLPGLIDTAILVNTPRYVDGKPVAVEGRTIGSNAPTEGMWRLTSPDEVAAAVWEAYRSDRVHWYVPAEIEQIEHEKLRSVEAMRDVRIAMQNAAQT